MDDEEAQFLLDDEDEKPAKKTPRESLEVKEKEKEVAGSAKVRSQPATEMSRSKGGNPKTGPGSRGGKGSKGGKGGGGAAKGEADKNDPAKPKKARSAYNFYLLKRIAQLKEEGVVEVHRDRFSQAAGEWRDMSFGERIPYEDMAKADKERHQKDLDIASRNLNAALLGSVEKHGQGMSSANGFPGLTALAANSPHEDVCAECNEEGDLLCCDFCPATHHLTCLDPPMLSLPSDDVQWACPACSAKVEVAKVEVAEMSAPQQKPKRDRKDQKKRPRTNSGAPEAGISSPKAAAAAVSTGGGNSFSVPKRKKGGKPRSKDEGGPPKPPRIKREEKEDRTAQHESTGIKASGNSANRMLTGPKKANISPRVGLGLADATDQAPTMRHPSLSGGGRISGDRNPSKAMMSLAVAAASVAASEAAVAAAVAAAAAAPPAPAPPQPKALGLKKLIHQRVQHDEANSISAFPPKQLLKQRLLAAKQTPATKATPRLAPPTTSVSAGTTGGSGFHTENAGNSRYSQQGDERRVQLANRGRYDHGGMVGDVFATKASQGGSMVGGGRGLEAYDESDRIAAEGVLNCRHVGDGGDRNRLRAMVAVDNDSNNQGSKNPGGNAGVFDRDRVVANGEHRCKAESGGRGFDAAGPSSNPDANEDHAGGVAGYGSRGGSEDQSGRSAKDVDAKQRRGYSSGSHGQELKVGQELVQKESRRGSRDGDSWEAASAAAPTGAHQGECRDSYSRTRAEVPRSEATPGSHGSSPGRGYNNKESSLAPPPTHRLKGERNSDLRPDRPLQRRESLERRSRSREESVRAGRDDGKTGEDCGGYFARPRGREDISADGRLDTSMLMSAEERRSDGGRRGSPAWDGDMSRSASTGDIGDEGRGDRFSGSVGVGIGVGSIGHRQRSDCRIGEKDAGGGNSGELARGVGGDGSFSNGWSERKRSLESFDGQGDGRGSPKKRASSPQTMGSSRAMSRSQPGHWNVERSNNNWGSAGFSGGGGRCGGRGRSRDSRDSRGAVDPMFREGWIADTRDHEVGTAAAGRARGGKGESGNRDDGKEAAWIGGGGGGGGVRSDRRGVWNSNQGGKTYEHSSWQKNSPFARDGPVESITKEADVGWQDAVNGRGHQAFHQRGGGGGGRGGGARVGRGHWKARLASAGGVGGNGFTPRGHPSNGERLREARTVPGTGGGPGAGWQERGTETGTGGSSEKGGNSSNAEVGSRQGGRSDEPVRNVDGRGRLGRQGELSHGDGASIHPPGGGYRSQARGASTGPGGAGADRRARDSGFRHGQLVGTGGSGRVVGDRGGGSRKEKDYSGFALPKPSPPTISINGLPTSPVGYAALAAGPPSSSSTTTATTATSATSAPRSDRGRSQGYDHDDRRSTTRSYGSRSSGRGDSSGTQSFHSRGTSESSRDPTTGFRPDDGVSKGGRGIGDVYVSCSNNGSSSRSRSRPARSRSSPSRSVRRRSASPNGWKYSFKRQGSSLGDDDHHHPRFGKSRSGWESRREAVGGERQAWKGRNEHHHNSHFSHQHGGKDLDRFNGRPDATTTSNISSDSSPRFHASDRRASFPGRGERGGFGFRGARGRGGVGRGRGRGTFERNNT